ncbi:MAG: hypothetical protein GWP06_17415 [Actinobacteria bacterium]|nr:hypothetical protein [Actinomycetota bacterium]
MKLELTTLLFCLSTILVQCHHSYKFIIDKTYFSESSDREYSAFADLREQTVLTEKGVYGNKQIGRKLFPAVFSFTGKGIAYTLLTDSLAVEKGAYTRVKGKPVIQKLSFGLKGAGMEVKALQVDEFHQLFQTSPFVTKSIKEYERLYSKFKSSLKPDHVKNWKFSPHWRSIVDENKSRVIVTSKTTDLMYQYEIDFVWQLKSGSLQAVYCRKWFKGE